MLDGHVLFHDRPTLSPFSAEEIRLVTRLSVEPGLRFGPVKKSNQRHKSVNPEKGEYLPAKFTSHFHSCSA